MLRFDQRDDRRFHRFRAVQLPPWAGRPQSSTLRDERRLFLTFIMHHHGTGKAMPRRREAAAPDTAAPAPTGRDPPNASADYTHFTMASSDKLPLRSIRGVSQVCGENASASVMPTGTSTSPATNCAGVKLR